MGAFSGTYFSMPWLARGDMIDIVNVSRKAASAVLPLATLAVLQQFVLI